MSQTYRPKKSLIWQNAACLAFFLVLGAASVGFFLFERKFQGAGERIVVAAVIGLFWSAFAAGAAYGIVDARVSELAFDSDRVRRKGPLGESYLRYDAVREVRWGLMHRRRVELRGKDDKGRSAKIELDLAACESRDALPLIRTIRARLGHAKHVGWDRFCRRIAIPLRDAANNVRRTPRSDERRLSRGRWDLIFAPSIVASGLASAWLASATGNAGGFAFVALLAAMWALLRFASPREGQIVRKRSPEEVRWLQVLGAATVALLVGLVALPAMPILDLPPTVERFAGFWALGLFLAWFSVVGLAMVRFGESQKEREAVDALGAAEEWEEGEQIVFVERGD